jgi:Xaa-Pro aminopeptidase
MGWLNAVRGKAQRRTRQQMIDARIWLDEMRLVKDAHELA